ncbi:TetR/AcrR family transcriptional regulator [Gordonia sp. CPCC 205515]|uniref:TetR/AcrR family transcriptional regulator n=1 Tax=Gordonia sp. CPCC 205515 TaxID=3140791 RepID=UPI003AF38E6B
MPSARVENDTYIHRARRTQLIDTAIEVITEVGAERASISQIAERAGVTRGVVTYHFRDRSSLLDAVVGHVYELARGALADRVQTAPSPRDALREFITGSLDFYARYPGEMTALSAIYRTTEKSRPKQGEHQTEMDDVTEILTAGQRSGQFRTFDPAILAGTLRAALDAALVRIREGAVVDDEKRELWTLFDAATRAAAR